jgi:RND family efflux transporter MFP subunit
MTSAARDEAPMVGLTMGRSLKDELASLKIERRGSRVGPAPARRPGLVRDGGGLFLRLLGLLLWLVPLGLLAGGSYFVYTQYLRAAPKTSVTTAVVRALSVGEASTLLDAKGYLKSRYQAKLGAKMPGRIEEVRVEEGSQVKKGDILAILEHDDLKAQLATRQAMLVRNEAERGEARADLAYKEAKSRRAQRLRALGQISEEERDQAVAEANMARAKLDALEASLEYQRAMIGETRVAIEDMHIRAPFDGTVVEKSAEVGETIMLGGLGAASGRGSVVTLANLGFLEVETDIAEDKLARIQIGQPAEVSVSAVPDARYRGRLRSLVPIGDRARGTVKVYVAVLNADERLFPELAATVHFLPEGGADESSQSDRRDLYVPRSAIVEAGGRTTAWVVDPDSRAIQARPVRAEIDGSRARVLEGLRAGEVVVTDPPATLREGQVVAISD